MSFSWGGVFSSSGGSNAPLASGTQVRRMGRVSGSIYFLSRKIMFCYMCSMCYIVQHVFSFELPAWKLGVQSWGQCMIRKGSTRKHEEQYSNFSYCSKGEPYVTGGMFDVDHLS